MGAWWLALVVLVACDDPLPPIVAFESGSTAELGPLRLDGPVVDLPLVRVGDDGSLDEVPGRDRLFSTDIVDATVEDEVLRGSTAVRLGGEVASLAIELDRPELVGRRIEVRFWQRPRGTRVEARLHWFFGDRPLNHRLGDPFAPNRLWEQGELLPLGSVDFTPTGRRTAEGWEEWTSGPVDFAFGGADHLTPHLVLRDVALDRAWRTGGTIRTDRTAALDLLQIVDVGPAAVPDRTCRLADEASRCGREGACALGRCVDATAVYGAFPSIDVVRSELSERRAQQLSDWTGPLETRDEVLEGAVDDVRSLGGPRVTSRGWWTGLAEAFRSLEDGHSDVGRSTRTPTTGGLCLDLGVAHLLGLEGTHPLVTNYFDTPPWSDVVELGDVLVEVDGEPAAKWIEDHARPLVGATGGPSYRAAADVTQSMRAAVAAGSLLTFERCPGQDGCAGSAIRFDVDLAEAASGVWRTTTEFPPDLLLPTPHACDHRLDPVVRDDASRDPGTYALGRRRDTPVLQLNGFSSSQVAQEVRGPVQDALVIDARAGTGGSVTAEFALAGLFTSSDSSLGLRFDPWFERPPDDAVLTACTQSGDWCFGSSFVGYDRDPGTGGVLQDVDLVLLNQVGVSANDIFALHLQQRCPDAPCGATTLMGGADTAGGFSPPITGPAWVGSVFAPILTPYDTKLVYDLATTSDYLVGTPVTMDEPVLQTQSDAVRGIDTQLEAALEALQ